jgi:S1-C subfamily serine protease
MLVGVPSGSAQEPSGLKALVALEEVLTDVIARTEKSVVAIARVKRPDRDEFFPLAPDAISGFPRRSPISQTDPEWLPDPDFIPNEYGTGVVIDPRGLILTNFHVLGGEDHKDYSFFVTTVERKTYRAEIRGADVRSDLAVLRLVSTAGPVSLEAIRFAHPGNVRKGQFVVSLGNPYAIARDGQPSASWGIVANIGRKAGPELGDARATKRTLHHFGTLIQTDARLNLGTSGGPLLNLKGEMIGLTTSLAALAGYEQAAGYAIPVDDAMRRVIDTLKEGRPVDYGFLGIDPRNLDPRDLQRGRHGLRVETVVPGTPAHREDLRREDVITEVDGRPVYDADGLFLLVGKLPAEAVVRLTVERNGRTLQKQVELAKYRVGKQVVTNPPPLWRGLLVDHVTATVEPEFLFSNGYRLDGCLGIAEVEEGTPAWKAGIRKDLFITHVDAAPVRTPREFRDAVAGKKVPVQVHVVRFGPENDQREVITVEPE